MRTLYQFDLDRWWGRMDSFGYLPHPRAAGIDEDRAMAFDVASA